MPSLSHSQRLLLYMCSPSRSFLHIFLFTTIHNLSISLPHSLALSPMYLSPPLSSATFTVTLQTCKPPRLFISLTLSLSSATLTHFTLFCFGCNLSVFLSPSLSFFPTLTVTFQTCTLSLSLSHVLTFLTLQPCSPPLFPLSLSFSISLPLSLFSHAHPFYYLLLWTPPPTLSLTPTFSLQPHTHTHTLYSLLLQIRPLSVYLQLR